jgi:hypothetical protein
MILMTTSYYNDSGSYNTRELLTVDFLQILSFIMMLSLLHPWEAKQNSLTQMLQKNYNVVILYYKNFYFKYN